MRQTKTYERGDHMDQLRYSTELEGEINLMSALLYAKLEEDGHWRKKIFHIESLMSYFKTGKANMYRQLNYLKDFGYIEYTKPYENKPGTVKTLKIVNCDSSIDVDALKRLPKFNSTRLKILTALSAMGQASTNQIMHYVETQSRSTISRVLLELQKANMIYSFCKVPHKERPNVMENIWEVA